jgi:hypothetical protein
MGLAYRVLLDKNKNACIDEFTSTDKAFSSIESILDKQKLLVNLDQALTRARIMGKNPLMVKMYHNGKFVKTLDVHDDIWEDSNQLLFKIFSNQRYIAQPLYSDIKLYFDDSEIAHFHKENKREKKLRHERFKRGAF